MKTLKYGAEQAVKNCAKVNSKERVVVITDIETFKIGSMISKEALKITNNVQLYVMEDYGKRTDRNPLKFPKEIGMALNHADVSFYVAGGKKGEIQSFRNPMLNIISKRAAKKKIRHIHMIGVNEKIMKTGMAVDYKKVAKMTAKIAKIVKKSKQIRVTTSAGTDFVTTFSPDYKWIAVDGSFKMGEWSNLPDGEVFTCAKNCNGIIVVDGLLGDFFGAKYGIMKNQPLIMYIKNSRVVKFECKNKKILREIKEYSKIDKNANRIGEFAIGTNIGLKKLVGIMVQDEKFPGIHVAMGHGYSEVTGANWNSKAHLDCVLLKTTIEVDGKIIMKKGEFLV
ncbi:MAG: aminopeptidase [Nanoarchaeota archaeon]|nr:aminopeptidase [Nanoarchaeota archaeon]